ncbi:MAG: hypothetical protein ACYS80_17805, partial [Planctomycetota bacterium]
MGHYHSTQIITKVAVVLLMAFSCYTLSAENKTSKDYRTRRLIKIDKLSLAQESQQLDPSGQMHIPIGIPNSLDSLKTFVEAEGNFSPGIGSYGIYFWVFDPEQERLTAPTFKHVACTHGLAEGRLLIPWSRWNAGAIKIRTEVCEVKCTHA